MASAKIKMLETYGQLLIGQTYRVDSGTAGSLVSMGKAETVAERKVSRRKRK